MFPGASIRRHGESRGVRAGGLGTSPEHLAGRFRRQPAGGAKAYCRLGRAGGIDVRRWSDRCWSTRPLRGVRIDRTGCWCGSRRGRRIDMAASAHRLTRVPGGGGAINAFSGASRIVAPRCRWRRQQANDCAVRSPLRHRDLAVDVAAWLARSPAGGIARSRPRHDDSNRRRSGVDTRGSAAAA